MNSYFLQIAIFTAVFILIRGMDIYNKQKETENMIRMAVAFILLILMMAYLEGIVFTIILIFMAVSITYLLYRLVEKIGNDALDLMFPSWDSYLNAEVDGEQNDNLNK